VLSLPHATERLPQDTLSFLPERTYKKNSADHLLRCHTICDAAMMTQLSEHKKVKCKSMGEPCAGGVYLKTKFRHILCALELVSILYGGRREPLWAGEKRRKEDLLPTFKEKAII